MAADPVRTGATLAAVDRWLAALVFAPFAAWYAYRACRALRSGVYELLGDPIERADRPQSFRFLVARDVLVAALFTSLVGLTLFGVSGRATTWVFGAAVAIYIVLHVVFRTSLSRRRS